MGEKNTTCCFTGHRPEKLPWGTEESNSGAVRLKSEIFAAVKSAYDDGYRHFICGMAKGCDLYFCEAVLALRFTEPAIMLEAAIPFEGQAEAWTAELRQRYYSLLRQCDSAYVLKTGYSPDCFTKRNRYMVDKSSRLIAAFGGNGGGTAGTISYAKKRGLDVILLNIIQK